MLEVEFKRTEWQACRRVIERCAANHEVVIAWHTVSILHYLVAKQHGSQVAKDSIRNLLAWAKVVHAGHDAVLLALHYEMPDFEDAMQAAAAEAAQAHCVVTLNTKDFKRSPVLAMTPKQWLKKFENV